MQPRINLNTENIADSTLIMSDNTIHSRKRKKPEKSSDPSKPKDDKSSSTTHLLIPINNSDLTAFDDANLIDTNSSSSLNTPIFNDFPDGYNNPNNLIGSDIDNLESWVNDIFFDIETKAETSINHTSLQTNTSSQNASSSSRQTSYSNSSLSSSSSQSSNTVTSDRLASLNFSETEENVLLKIMKISELAALEKQCRNIIFSVQKPIPDKLEKTELIELLYDKIEKKISNDTTGKKKKYNIQKSRDIIRTIYAKETVHILLIEGRINRDGSKGLINANELINNLIKRFSSFSKGKRKRRLTDRQKKLIPNFSQSFDVSSPLLSTVSDATPIFNSPSIDSIAQVDWIDDVNLIQTDSSSTSNSSSYPINDFFAPVSPTKDDQDNKPNLNTSLQINTSSQNGLSISHQISHSSITKKIKGVKKNSNTYDQELESLDFLLAGKKSVLDIMNISQKNFLLQCKNLIVDIPIELDESNLIKHLCTQIECQIKNNKVTKKKYNIPKGNKLAREIIRATYAQGIAHILLKEPRINPDISDKLIQHLIQRELTTAEKRLIPNFSTPIDVSTSQSSNTVISPQEQIKKECTRTLFPSSFLIELLKEADKEELIQILLKKIKYEINKGLEKGDYIDYIFSKGSNFERNKISVAYAKIFVKILLEKEVIIDDISDALIKALLKSQEIPDCSDDPYAVIISLSSKYNTGMLSSSPKGVINTQSSPLLINSLFSSTSSQHPYSNSSLSSSSSQASIPISDVTSSYLASENPSYNLNNANTKSAQLQSYALFSQHESPYSSSSLSSSSSQSSDIISNMISTSADLNNISDTPENLNDIYFNPPTPTLDEMENFMGDLLENENFLTYRKK